MTLYQLGKKLTVMMLTSVPYPDFSMTRRQLQWMLNAAQYEVEQYY